MCTVEGCDRPVQIKKRGLCKMHWNRWWRHGDPTVCKVRMRRDGPEYCTVGSCDRVVNRRGWCATHWARYEKHGDVFASVPVGKLRAVLRERDPVPSCVDCEGEPMPGGALRCLSCFHRWMEAKHGSGWRIERARRRSQAVDRARYREAA